MKNNIERLYVINLNGNKEPFSFQKVYNSARRVGASRNLAQDIARIIKKKAYPGIKTSEIFSNVTKMLNSKIPKAALRFNLKKGMKKLGPTGFPFEKFVGEVLKRLGYNVEINQYLPGYCIRNYEIDFVAKKGNIIYVGECKYRNLPGEKVHSRDALASYARFSDISNGSFFKSKKYQNFKIKTMIVTNAKFTKKTLDYCECTGISALGWRYPRTQGLECLIEENKLYPITILPGLNSYLANFFVSKKIMLAQDILTINPKELSKELKIPERQILILKKQAESLLF
jgi:Holliday junction resolvase